MVCFTLLQVFSLGYLWSIVRKKTGPPGIRGLKGDRGVRGLPGNCGDNPEHVICIKELTELLNAPELDRERAVALMINKSQNKADVVESQAPGLGDAIAEFTDSLNSEQRAKAVKFIERKMGYGRGGKYHGGHGGKGHHKDERTS